MALAAPAPQNTLLLPKVEKEPCNINVFFRLIDGKTFCLWLDPSIEIQALKEAIVAHQRNTSGTASLVVAASKDVFLIWNGKPLEEDLCLNDYSGLNNNATIFVSYRKKGGCFMVSASVLAMVCAAVVGSTCTCGLSLLVVPLLLPLLFILPLFCL